MKITFVEVNQHINTGSYRIWVKDLSDTLNEMGVRTEIVHNNSEISPDVISGVSSNPVGAIGFGSPAFG